MEPHSFNQPFSVEQHCFSKQFSMELHDSNCFYTTFVKFWLEDFIDNFIWTILRLFWWIDILFHFTILRHHFCGVYINLLIVIYRTVIVWDAENKPGWGSRRSEYETASDNTPEGKIWWNCSKQTWVECGRRQHCIGLQLWETPMSEPATTCHLARETIIRQLKQWYWTVKSSSGTK